MSRLRFVASFFASAALFGFTLTPNTAFAQRGGGGHSGGGGGGFHGSSGGGGFHSGGGFEGGHSYGGEGYSRGGFGGEGGSFGRSSGFGGSRGMSGRSGSMEGGRESSFGPDRASSVPRAINDGQWHSFNGGAGSHTGSNGVGSNSASRSAPGRGFNGTANSSLTAHNMGIADGAWHSFGTARTTNTFVGAGRSSFAFYGSWRGGYYGWGWGHGWGWGWGWGCCGWGWGWPYWSFYWGPGWGWGWAWYGSYYPWGYDPYWYAPWPMYNPDYYYNDGDDVRPPYRPGVKPPSNAPGTNQPSPNQPAQPGQQSNPTTGVSPTTENEATDVTLNEAPDLLSPLHKGLIDAGLENAGSVRAASTIEDSASADVGSSSSQTE